MVNGTLDAVKLLGEWNGYLWYAAGRYEVPGKADRDDLYQAACIGLLEAVKSLPNDKGLDSDDFKRLAKTCIWHNVLDAVRPFLTAGRNYRLEISGSNTFDKDLYATQLFDVLPDLKNGNPARLASLKEIVVLVKKELAKTPKALALFENMLDPDSGIVETYRIHEDSLAERGSGSEARGSHNYIGCGIPLPIFADVLGMSYKESRTALRKVREAVAKILHLREEAYPAIA